MMLLIMGLQAVLKGVLSLGVICEGGGGGLVAASAGFWARFAALLIDALVLMVPGVILQISSGGIFLFFGFTFFGFTFLISWLYFALQESSEFQATLGKRALGLIVTDEDGGRLSLGRASWRWFAHGLSNLSLCIGYLIQPALKSKQSLHDLFSGTLVLNKQYMGSHLGATKVNSSSAEVAIVVFAIYAAVAGGWLWISLFIPTFSGLR